MKRNGKRAPMSEATKEKLREAYRARVAIKEDFPVPVLAEPEPSVPAMADKDDGGEAREATSIPTAERLSERELESRGGEKEFEAVVAKVCMNPRLVEAGGDGVSRRLVDVGRNHNFAIGDVVIVRAHPEMSDVCEFVRMADEELAVDHVGLPRDKRRVYR